jgi:hypothetical protein
VCVPQMISVYDTLARGHPGGVVSVVGSRASLFLFCVGVDVRRSNTRAPSQQRLVAPREGHQGVLSSTKPLCLSDIRRILLL